MNARTIAALLAAVALPVAAQNATPRVATPGAPQAKVQKDVKKAESKASPRERAKVAKAKKKQDRKKAAAT